MNTQAPEPVSMAAVLRLAKIADAHQSETRAAFERLLLRLDRIERQLSIPTTNQPQEGTDQCQH